MHLKEEEYVNQNLPEGWKPYYIYSMIQDHQEVGKITLREGSIEERYFDGHIGYSVDKVYQGHGYAYQACLLLLKEAKEKGFCKLIITCDPNNIASKKTIHKLGAKYLETQDIPKHLRKDFSQEERVKDIYLIKLEDI